MYLYREHYKEINMAQKRVSFVNRVSHELKTPLTNIRMYAELMADKINPKDGLGKHIHVITTESQRLSRLIDNVLNFSRSQRERLKLNKLKCNPDEHLNAVINVVEPIMKSAGVEVCLGKITNQPVYLDPELFEQIMINLLSNAEKYAACGKKVDISAEIKDQNLIIYVQDYGPGIQQNQSLKIFEPFYRISSKLTDGVSGAGIGLSIAKELALLHGGNLELVTSNLGKGCCFKLTLNISDPNST